MRYNVRIKAYLADLKAAERRAPPASRRAVPSVEDLAETCGVQRETMSKFINGKRKTVDLDLLDGVTTALEARGFSPVLDDLIATNPPADGGK